MKKIKAVIISSILAIGCGQALACGDETFIGQICTFAFNFCPKGFAPADGKVLKISENSALFALLGKTYGGDGETTFALPDLRGRSVVGTGMGTNLLPVNLGAPRGQENVALTVDNLPSHTHTTVINVSTATGTLQVPVDGSMLAAGNAGGQFQATIYTDGSTQQAKTVKLGGVSVTAAGSATPAPVATIPPQIGLTQCIAVTGLFPPRNN